MRTSVAFSLLLFHLLSCKLFAIAIDASHSSVLEIKATAGDHADQLIHRHDHAPGDDKPPLLAIATQADVERARAIVQAAIQQVSKHNKARLDKPQRNNYKLKANIGTVQIAAAAALVAEADAYEEAENNDNNSTSKRQARLEQRNRVTKFWLGNTKHVGSWPFGNNDKSFVVFRDVTDPKYGAKGDGITDDTAAIRRAVSDGNMCGPGCYSSTTKGAIIYFPPGVYLVSGTIETYYGTQFIGDAVDRPVIKAAASFTGLGVISTDKYVENGGTGSDGNAKQWFINTANFYRQIRNFVIDITATNPNAYVCALHYQVAQATSLQFVEFRAKTGTTQQGIYAENGSGGFMSDLIFNGGNFGIYGGNQQFTAHRLTFNGCTTAVQLIWDWGWAWKSIYIKDADVGFKLLSEDGVHTTGSILVVDSVFDSVGTAILTFPAEGKKNDGTTGLTLDNVKFINTKRGVVDTAGASYLSSDLDIDTFVLGRIYVDQKKSTALHTRFPTKRDPTLVGSDNPWNLPKAPFYEKAKPQYTDIPVSQVRHVKDSCKGDGKTDDTQCIQRFLNDHASGSLIYFDAGSYMISDTVTIPNNAVIVGENWAQLVAFGERFADARHPRPMIRVGQKGQRGNVEMQDLIFTSKGPTAGVVFVEWNIKASAAGKAVKECPAGSQNDKCKAGSALMHIKPDASGYFENVWLWVADHDIDDPNWQDDNNFMEQCSIFVARGLLVESTTATWLYGTSSEHAVFYQYEFFNAKSVAASMIQTESPYFQPTPNPPAPFRDAVGTMPGDPAYKCGSGETCDSSWALRIVNSSQIMIHGAGLYSWFNTYTQDCLQTMDCQKSLIDLQGNFGNVRIHNLVTIGAVNMMESDGMTIAALDNQAVEFHPRWSHIAVFDPRQFKNPCTQEPADTNPAIPPGADYGVRTETDGLLAYLTIVNGCPYDFEFLGSHQWQMKDWDGQWVTVPAGESAQFKIEFMESSHIEDTAGEAYYQLKGRPLANPTGYGYWSSANPPVAWMHAILDIIGDRKLKYVCMPGSHDAGISKIDGNTALANWANTQTQWLDFYGQLMRGSRWFDVRPCLGNGGKHMLCHYTVTAGLAVGGNGLSVDDMINQINSFMDDHPGELIILDVNDESGFDTDNRTPSQTYNRLTAEQWRPIWHKI
ncbi:pectate lyase superfamily protein-domain-containing protein [Triangularia verruculosa]|uniref:Pectate lyase superfamily protein-domain-containing protein n=1 Tax=Triangularia verruculosa TaxID=2587418 RepID=A0AAN6XRP5_9PEZI|nr:pectate lyase superfamily protein-domain-containing protein [Triangularia verruculosa]